MIHHIQLKRFEYHTAAEGSMVKNGVHIDIDFEAKNLALEGEGIKVRTSIYPGFGVDLSDNTGDGLVFSLEGILEDNKTINSCSGLLVLYSTMERKDQNTRDWRLALYLYDDYNSSREIKLNLAMWPFAEKPELN